MYRTHREHTLCLFRSMKNTWRHDWHWLLFVYRLAGQVDLSVPQRNQCLHLQQWHQWQWFPWQLRFWGDWRRWPVTPPPGQSPPVPLPHRHREMWTAQQANGNEENKRGTRMPTAESRIFEKPAAAPRLGRLQHPPASLDQPALHSCNVLDRCQILFFIIYYFSFNFHHSNADIEHQATIIIPPHSHGWRPFLNLCWFPHLRISENPTGPSTKRTVWRFFFFFKYILAVMLMGMRSLLCFW